VTLNVCLGMWWRRSAFSLKGKMASRVRQGPPCYPGQGSDTTKPIPATTPILVLTSRVSVELVQKAAAMGVLVLAAMSAPTALAVRTANRAGMTVIGVARDDGFEVFTHPHRVRRTVV